MSHNSFGTAAQTYFDAGWKPIPGKKSDNTPAVSRHSGRNNLRVANQSQLDAWKNVFRDSSVNLRMWDVEDEKGFEIIGIDVDHYNEKKGYDSLKELEKELGPLPATWRSSSRGAMDENPSGIRFYKIPSGLNCWDFKGRNIDVIWKGNRYATVWPSVSGKTGRHYRWYRPDDSLAPVGIVPTVQEIPELPEAWVNEVTKQREKFFSVNEDMLANVEEIHKWIDTTLFDFYGEMCDCTKRVFEKRMSVFEDTLEHHEPQKETIWQLCQMALEHHKGCGTAIDRYIEAWIEDAGKKEKRDFTEAQRELKNSYEGAMRKLFGKELKDNECGLSNNVIPVFASLVSSPPGPPAPPGPPSEFDNIPNGGMKPVNEYAINDDGNAEHFIDYWSRGDQCSLRWVEGYGWLIWNSGENPHWERDEKGDGKIRRMWRQVALRQEMYADACWADFQNKRRAFEQNPNGAVTAEDVKAARAIFDKWQKHALNSGKNKNAKDAIEAAKSIRGIALDINKLDSDRRLMGVANGVLELTADGARLRQVKQKDYLMFNTGIPYEKPNDSSIGTQLWQEYLDTFLPDPTLRETAQIALGHCVLGGNPEKRVIVLKGVTNTGKSTMVAMIEKSLGDYAGSVGQGLFKNSGFNTDFLTCANKRAVILSEFEEEDRLSASVIKRLSGNSDRMTTPIKNSNAIFSAIPQFVPILPTNAVPTITGADRALQDRLFVIPFNVRPTEINRNATNILIEMAGQACFWWLIEGYNKYCALGELPVSQEVQQETKDFISNLDEVATFASECVRQHSRIDDPSVEWKKYPDWCVTRSAMYEEFRRWWDTNNLNMTKIPSAIKLTNRLRELGLPGTPGKQTVKVGGESNRWWFGVKVSPNAGTVSRLPGFKVSPVQSVTESVTEEN